MREIFKKFLNHFSDLLFPGNCPVCEKEPYQDGLSYMCRECEDSLAWISKDGCKYCSIPMSGFNFNGLVCAACRDDPPSFSRGKSLFLLDQNGKKVIHEIKYSGVKDVLKDIPNWLKRNPSFFDFLKDSTFIPVPLHKRRLKKRGFNQSVWIAHALQRELGKSVRVEQALQRVKDTSTQTKLDRRARKRNVKDAFILKNKHSLDEKNRIILLSL